GPVPGVLLVWHRSEAPAVEQQAFRRRGVAVEYFEIDGRVGLPGENAFAEVPGDKGSKNKTDSGRLSFCRLLRLHAVAIDWQVNDKPRFQRRAVRRVQRDFPGRRGSVHVAG